MAGALSGGNQQKVVLGKWLSMKPKVMIFDEPTRGIDVGSKSEIYTLMRALADAGVAILMISSDMEEVIGVSDRIVVMQEGAISGTLKRDQFSEENVMRLAVARGRGTERGVMLKKDLGLFLLILVVGAVVAFLNPRFISPINLANTANLVGLFGLFSIGEGFRHHHRRHRPFDRFGVRPVRRHLRRPARDLSRALGDRGPRDRGVSACFSAGCTAC